MPADIVCALSSCQSPCVAWMARPRHMAGCCRASAHPLAQHTRPAEHAGPLRCSCRCGTERTRPDGPTGSQLCRCWMRRRPAATGGSHRGCGGGSCRSTKRETALLMFVTHGAASTDTSQQSVNACRVFVFIVSPIKIDSLHSSGHASSMLPLQSVASGKPM